MLKLQQAPITTALLKRSRKKVKSRASQDPDYAKVKEVLEFLLPDEIHGIKCLILIIYLVWFKRIKISNSGLAVTRNMSPLAGTLQRATSSYTVPVPPSTHAH